MVQCLGFWVYGLWFRVVVVVEVEVVVVVVGVVVALLWWLSWRSWLC